MPLYKENEVEQQNFYLRVRYIYSTQNLIRLDTSNVNRDR